MGIPETEKERKALKVADIREHLEEAGLDANGTKPVLLERLEEVRLVSRISSRLPQIQIRSARADARSDPSRAAPRADARASESRRPPPDPKPPSIPCPHQHVAKLAAAASGAPPADAPADTTPEAAAPEAAAADVPPPPTTADVPPPPTTADVPPPPPAAAAPESDDEPDGGEHAVLVCGDACVDDASVAAAVASACATPPLTVALLSRGAAAVTFPDERAARAAVAAFAANPNLNLSAEALRRTLWPEEEAACDVRKTEVLVAGVPETIGDDAVRQVMGTYGAVSAVRRDGETTRVTMATREGAETATAALSGVYKFEEAQPAPVVVTWCEPGPEAVESVEVGSKRKREDGDEEASGAAAAAREGRQLLVVGLPQTATREDVMGYFPSESGAAVDAHVLSANRAAFVAFATAEAAEAHLAARNGTLRPPGSALPVTLRRVVVDVGSRRKRREGVAAHPEGVWPPVPKPGPQYGEPSPKIYIGSIPAQYDEPDVRAIFSTVGAIKDIKILRQPDGRHKGSGFVTYHDIASTERAIHFIDGRYVLNAPDFPSQRPIYMKYASVGGGGGGARGGYPQGQRAAPGMGAMGAMGMAGGAHAGYAGYHHQYAAPQHAAAAAAYQHAYYGGAYAAQGAYAGAQGAYAGAQGAYAGAQGAYAGAQGAYGAQPAAYGGYAQQQQGAAAAGWPQQQQQQQAYYPPQQQ